MPNTNDEITVSLFFLGTGQHREDLAPDGGALLSNILTQFSSNAINAFKDGKHFVHTFDGPAGKSPHAATQHPMPGLYIYKPDTKIPGKGEKVLKSALSDGNRPAQLSKLSQKFEIKLQKILGNLTGDGVEDNLLEALLYLQQLIDLKKMPKPLNLYGHSRGSDTALRLANILAKLLPDIEINLFLNEPVAGPNRKGHYKARYISRNVKNCEIVLTEHVDGALFEATDKRRLLLEDPANTRVNYHLYYGDHTSPIKFRDLNPAKELVTDHTAMLNWGTMYRFAVKFGTLAKDTLIPKCAKNSKSNAAITTELFIYPEQYDSALGRLLLFEQMKDQAWTYSKRFKTKIKRDFVLRREDYVADPEVFINQEHRELFKEVLPKTFDWIFQKACAETSYDEVISELNTLFTDYRNHPAYSQLHELILESLKTAGARDGQGHFFLPHSPLGRAHIEPSPIKNNLPVVYDELSRLQYGITKALDATFLSRFDDRLKRLPLRSSLMHEGSVVAANDLRRSMAQIMTQNLSDAEKCQLLKQQIVTSCNALKETKAPPKLIWYLQSLLGAKETYAELLQAVLHKYAAIFEQAEFYRTSTFLEGEIAALHSLQKHNTLTPSAVNAAITSHLQNTILHFKQNAQIHNKKPEECKQLLKDLGYLKKFYQQSFSLTDNIIKDLRNYMRYNKLKALLRKFVYITLGEPKAIADTEELSKFKYAQARKLIENLQTLKSVGQSDDLAEVKEILDSGLNATAPALSKTNMPERTFEETLRKWKAAISIADTDGTRTSVEVKRLAE